MRSGRVLVTTLLILTCLLFTSGSDPSVPKLLLITILSRPEDFATRQLMRECLYPLPCFSDSSVKLIFTIGNPGNVTNSSQILDALNEEITSNQDILYLDDVEDKWRHIAEKFRRFLKYAYSLEYHFIMKLDDDAYVNFHQIIKYLTTLVVQNRSQYYYSIGPHVRDQVPCRNPTSRYYISIENYPRNFYPVFCLGYGHILSTSLVKNLVENGYLSNYTFSQDISMGLSMENYMKTNPKDPWRIDFVGFPLSMMDLGIFRVMSSKHPSKFYNMVHRVSEIQMRCLYNYDIHLPSSKYHSKKFDCIKSTDNDRNFPNLGCH